MEPTVNKHLLLFLSCFVLLFISFNAISQNTILNRKIDVNFTNKRTEDVLNEMSKKGRFYFTYSSSLINKDKLITIRAKNISIHELLKQIFGDDIIPVETGKYIILKPNVKSEDEKSSGINIEEGESGYTISGYIIDANTGRRLSNATVYEIGKTNSVLTNFDGYYKINVSTSNDNLGLAYSSYHFKDTIIVIQPANHSINMRLRPKEAAPELIEKKGFENPHIFKDSLDLMDELPLVKFAVKKRQFNLSKNLDFIEKQHIQLSLIPQIGTNRLMSGNVENNISLNLLGGYSYSVKGIELGGFLNIVRNDVKWFQLSGFGNIVGGNTRGVQLAGIANNNRKSIKGVQVAGISNIVLDTIYGVQISGISNVLRGKMKGLQLSGFSNLSTQDVDGMQISGFNNIAWKNVNLAQISGFANMGQSIGGAQISGFVNYGTHIGGIQLAGFVNYADGNVGGLQMAGFLNIAEKVNSAQIAGYANLASKEIRGVQIAGILNIANKVKGAQLAFINLADSVSGVSVGFLSIVRQGMHKLELSFAEDLYTRLSFKTGTHRFYNIFSGGINTQNTDFWTAGYGIGTEIRSKKRFYFAVDISTSYINEGFDNFEKVNVLQKIETIFGWNLFRSSGISIGPSFNLFISDWKEIEGNFLSKYPPFEQFSISGSGYRICGWAGGKIALRF